MPTSYEVISATPMFAAGVRGETLLRGIVPPQGVSMNSNQVKGTVKDLAGKAQEKFGEATGSASQQVKGAAKQVEGKVQKGAGDVQQAAEDANRGKVK